MVATRYVGVSLLQHSSRTHRSHGPQATATNGSCALVPASACRYTNATCLATWSLNCECPSSGLTHTLRGSFGTAYHNLENVMPLYLRNGFVSQRPQQPQAHWILTSSSTAAVANTVCWDPSSRPTRIVGHLHTQYCRNIADNQLTGNLLPLSNLTGLREL